jgi:hypothetical protein
MATSTTRVGLVRPEAGDTALARVDFSSNMDKIDTAIGAQVVTSSTRPSSTYSGKPIWETNTQAEVVHDGSAWRYASTPVAASTSTITATHTGQLAVQTNDNTVSVYSGSAWRYVSAPIAASATSITRVHTGLLAVQTGDTTLKIHNGTSFVAPVNQATCELATFVHTGTQSVANNSDVYVNFNGTAEATSTYISQTTVASASLFTINKAGVYSITAQVVFASSTTGKREVHIVNGANANVRWGTNTVDCSGNPLGTPNCAALVRLAVNDTIKIMCSQNSGGALDLEVKSWGVRPRVSFAYLGV